MNSCEERRQVIIDTLEEAFSDLMEASPLAFRTKFRKMAADPFAFYRGSASLFYADMAGLEDRWADERTSLVWIHGDLHAENFGTYMNSHGVLVFDVNDFHEAYVGHFSWDLRRFCASLALLGWQKAFPEDDVRELTRTYLRAYLNQVRDYAQSQEAPDFALRLDNTDGFLRHVLRSAQSSSRLAFLDSMTQVRDGERRFSDSGGARRLEEDERATVLEAYEGYLESIPRGKRERNAEFYAVKDIVGMSGFGIGSAGLPAYNILIEGYDQALENDLVIAMKQANVPAPSRIVNDPTVRDYFEHEGHRTAVSRRALQAHADPLVGYTTIAGVGYIANELSPYETDLDFGDLTEPEDVAGIVSALGRATAKMHCVADADSDQTLVDFQTQDAITTVIGSEEDAFVEDFVAFGSDYAEQVRGDHSLFVEAFRSERIGGVTAS